MSNKRYTVSEGNGSGIRIKQGAETIRSAANKAVALATRKPGESDYDVIVRKKAEAEAAHAPAIEAGQTAKQAHLARLAGEFERGWRGVDGYEKHPNGAFKTGPVPEAPANPAPVGASTNIENEMARGARQRAKIAAQSAKARQELQERKDRAFAEGWRGQGHKPHRSIKRLGDDREPTNPASRDSNDSTLSRHLGECNESHRLDTLGYRRST